MKDRQGPVLSKMPCWCPSGHSRWDELSGEGCLRSAGSHQRDKLRSMRSGWFRDHLRAIIPRLGSRVLAICTILGGIAGVVYMANEVGVMPSLWFAAAFVLAFSIAVNIRQAFLWKPGNEARQAAETDAEHWRKRSDSHRALYEELKGRYEETADGPLSVEEREALQQLRALATCLRPAGQFAYEVLIADFLATTIQRPLTDAEKIILALLRDCVAPRWPSDFSSLERALDNSDLAQSLEAFERAGLTYKYVVENLTRVGILMWSDEFNVSEVALGLERRHTKLIERLDQIRGRTDVGNLLTGESFFRSPLRLDSGS